MKSTISLCVICGNVEEYAERWIKSFLPIAAEVCLVRAIGSLIPDQTVSIIERECASAGVPLRFGEYKNAPGHEEWPHIDNFAAARQASFDLATQPYCFWCDSDDVLESGAETIIQHASRAEYPVYMFPYRIFSRGITVLRERLILKNSGKWKYPVHECFAFTVEPATGVSDESVVITHLPKMTKEGSNMRNLTILRSIPDDQMTPGMLFHLQGELAGIGDKAGSVEAAKRALADPTLGQPERYELFLNLGMLTEDLKLRHQYWHLAHSADPTRREALGLLAGNSMDLGRNMAALAYARQMMSCIRPKIDPWNLRHDMYGWIGNDVYSQALRVNGMDEQADLVRQETYKKHGGPRIALIHATRGRPRQASQARKMWLSLANKPELVEHIFVIDGDDEDSIPLKRMHHVVIKPGGGCVAAWNLGTARTHAPVVIQMSDDWTPPQNWDELVLSRIGDVSKPAVLAVSDGVRCDQLLCMVIATRKYFTEDQFMFHPWFKGVYSDNWFTEQAYKRGLVIEARDLVFNHHHPLFEGGQLDQTYTVQNSPERYAEGKALLEYLRKGNDWSSVPGWFNYYDLYEFIANRLKDGDRVVEIGCWFGRSSIYLAQALKRLGKPNCKITVVDTFKGEVSQPEHLKIVAENGGSILGAFRANIERCGVADMFTIIEGDSAESAKHIKDRSLAFCYIDAAHDYASVKKDIAAWRNKVKEDGLLAGHDAQWHEVRKAVNEDLPNAEFYGVVWVNGAL